MEPLIAARGLTKNFVARRDGRSGGGHATLTAVDNLTFELHHGQTLGLVGESGCGKTTTAKMLLRLETPTSGEVLLEGSPVHAMSGKALMEYRSKVQAVFQDPWSSLNPRMRVGEIVAEPLVIRGGMKKVAIRARVEEVLEQVGLGGDILERYPHEFSGGQRQRIAIAAALVPSPGVIVLDEPVSALDVSIRAQVMNLLKDLQDEQGVAYVLIAHDLGTVRFMADQIGILYLGALVEIGSSDRVFDEPLHPYTKALTAASLPSHPDQAAEVEVIQGEIPSPFDPPSGCRFNPRCKFAMDICSVKAPTMEEVRPGHWTACHLHTSENSEVMLRLGPTNASNSSVRDSSRTDGKDT